MDQRVLKQIVSYAPCDNFLVMALVGIPLLAELDRIDYFRRTCVTRLGKNLWYWFRKGILPRHPYWTSVAVRQGDLELLKALKLDSQPWWYNVNTIAICTGNIELLKWLRSTENRDDPFGRPAEWSVYFEFEAALREGDIELLDWLWDNKCPLPFFAFCDASRCKKDPFRVIRWLWEKCKTPRDIDLPDQYGESPLDPSILMSNGYAGNVEIMTWVLSLGDHTPVTITKRDISRAAEYCHLETMKWLYEHEKYRELVKDALTAGNLIREALIFSEEITIREIEFIKWLLEHGCKLDRYGMYYLISTGNTELIELLHAHRPCEGDTMQVDDAIYETLIEDDALDVLKLARSFGILPPYPSEPIKLLNSPSIDTIKWLRQDGLPWQPDFLRLGYNSQVDLAKLTWLRSVSRLDGGDPWGRPCPWNPELHGDIIRQYEHLRFERVIEYISWLRKPVGGEDGDVIVPDPCPWPIIFTEETLRSFDHIPYALINALSDLGYVLTPEEQTRINNFEPI